MEAQNEIPILLQLMFGEAAGTALRGASPRLLLWCQAFDEWLAERKLVYSKADRKQALLVWRRLYHHTSQMPWELRPADINRHKDRLATEGIVPQSICTDLSILSVFYRWCAEKGVDPECGPNFNPASGVPRPKLKPCSNPTILSHGENEALLRTLRADRSPLGLRDYAFILARIKLCALTQNLQRLQWGQIRVEEARAWVQWRPGTEPVCLPDEVWEAIRDFLAASGRLPTLVDDSYIFPPLANAYSEDPGCRPQDWLETPLSSPGILKNLKVYGRLAGIPEEKLNFRTLRRTAIRLQLDSGDSTEEIQVSAGWRRPVRNTKCLLRALPTLPEEPKGAGGREIRVRKHGPRYFQPGEMYKHGFFARSQPPEAIQAMLAEDIHGVDEQVSGLRALGRGLSEWKLKAGNFIEDARLMEMYTQVTGWLAELLRIEELLANRKEEQPWDFFLDHIEKYCLDEGETLDREALAAKALGTDPGLGLSARHLREEVATLRFNLREAANAQGVGDYLRLVFLYGRGSVRLARLLSWEKAGQGQLAAYLEKVIDQVVEEIVAEWK